MTKGFSILLMRTFDNALAENFFSILKTECIRRVKLKTYEQASLLIGEYINYYNNYRMCDMFLTEKVRH